MQTIFFILMKKVNGNDVVNEKTRLIMAVCGDGLATRGVTSVITFIRLGGIIKAN